MADTPDSKGMLNTLQLMTHNKKTVFLTASMVERWFAKVEKSLSNTRSLPEQTNSPLSSAQNNAQNKALAMQLIGRFGLKSAADVIIFLNSAAGQTTKAVIAGELAELAAQQENINFVYQEQQAKHHRMIAFLLLGLIYEEKACAQELNRLIDKQIAQNLKQNAKAINTRQVQPSEANSLYNTLETYQNAIDAVHGTLSDTLLRSAALEKEIESIPQLSQAIKDSYNIFYTHLDAVQQDIADSFKKLNLHHSHINKPQYTDKIELLKNFIENKIQSITKDIESNNLIISDLLDKNEDDKAKNLMRANNAMNLQVAELKDQFDLVRGDKLLYNANGEPATSSSEAYFILTKEFLKQQKIVIQDDKYFLLNAGQKIEDLTLEEKKLAQKSYEKIRPDILSVRKVSEHNLALEDKDMKDSLFSRSKIMQQDIIFLTNQLSQLQAAHGKINTILTQSPSITLTPKPSMTALPSNPTPTFKASVKNLPQQSYQHIVALMERLERMSPLNTTEFDAKQLNSLENLRRGVPIPVIAMQAMLRNIERFGVDATPAATTSIKNPLELQAVEKFNPTPTPSPFKMKPH